jgi:hypothetical protein
MAQGDNGLPRQGRRGHGVQALPKVVPVMFL